MDKKNVEVTFDEKNPTQEEIDELKFKTIHFYDFEPKEEEIDTLESGEVTVYHGLSETLEAIKNCKACEEVHTTQLYFLNMSNLFRKLKFELIVIHEKDRGPVHLFYNAYKDKNKEAFAIECKEINREIKIEDNILSLWVTGELDNIKIQDMIAYTGKKLNKDLKKGKKVTSKLIKNIENKEIRLKRPKIKKDKDGNKVEKKFDATKDIKVNDVYIENQFLRSIRISQERDRLLKEHKGKDKKNLK